MYSLFLPDTTMQEICNLLFNLYGAKVKHAFGTHMVLKSDNRFELTIDSFIHDGETGTRVSFVSTDLYNFFTSEFKGIMLRCDGKSAFNKGQWSFPKIPFDFNDFQETDNLFERLMEGKLTPPDILSNEKQQKELENALNLIKQLIEQYGNK